MHNKQCCQYDPAPAYDGGTLCVVQSLRTPFSSCSALWLALALVAPVHAAVPSILGTYTGSGDFNEFGCITPPFSDSGTFSITFTIGAQQGTSFSGDGSVTDTDDGEVSSLTLDGDILADGSVSGTFTSTEQNGDQSAGTYTGSLVGNTLTVSFTGADIGGDMCNFDGSFTVTRGGAINPAVTAGTGAITPIVFFATVATPSTLTSTHLRTVFKSMLAGTPTTGAVPVADGFMLQSDSGMAAGDGFSYPWGAWASYSHSEYEDDFVSTAFDADRNNVTVGLDFSPWDRIVAGVSLGYENNDIDTTFNGGNIDSDMITVAPYIGGLLNDTFSVDFSIGYSNIDIDQFRTLAGTRITSSVDAERRFVAGNLNASRAFGNWYVSGRAGLLYAKEEQDAFVESDGTLNPDRSFELGQLRVGGDVLSR